MLYLDDCIDNFNDCIQDANKRMAEINISLGSGNKSEIHSGNINSFVSSNAVVSSKISAVGTKLRCSAKSDNNLRLMLHK